MATIKIDQATVGMIVASDIKDRSGRILMRSSSELTEKYISSLKTWGVRFVEIISEEAATPPAVIDPTKIAEAENITESLFRHTDREHPIIKELRALCVQRLASKPSEK